jgi:hypothetical protein
LQCVNFSPRHSAHNKNHKFASIRVSRPQQHRILIVCLFWRRNRLVAYKRKFTLFKLVFQLLNSCLYDFWLVSYAVKALEHGLPLFEVLNLLRV